MENEHPFDNLNLPGGNALTFRAHEKTEAEFCRMEVVKEHANVRFLL